MQAAPLIELLEGYPAIDSRESQFRERMLALAKSAAPFARTSFDPGHFTASSFVLSPDGGAILLILHKKLGRWLQPGGHIDGDDVSVAFAARREALEETGLSELPLERPAIFDLDIHPIPERAKEPAHEHFDVRFAFRAQTLALAPSSEVAGARWVALSEVAGLTPDESVLRAIRKLG